MIEVDIELLQDNIERYNKILKKIQDNNNDIFYNFNNIYDNWHDKKSKELEEHLIREKKKIYNLENNIKEQISIYEFIKEKYKDLGNKIKCNLDSKTLIDDKLNIIIKLLEDIINQYNELGDISFFSEAEIIKTDEDKTKSIYKEFIDLRQNILFSYDSIEEIEKELIEKTKDIDIEKIVLNNYESEII